MENYPTALTVAAALMVAEDGRVLMQKRPAEKQHGGLWEFPGGKVEPGETPPCALVRELNEELGIAADRSSLRLLATAEDWAGNGSARVVILLYSCDRWCGEPTAEAGAEIGWFAKNAIAGLAMPPLDRDLLRKLTSRVG